MIFVHRKASLHRRMDSARLRRMPPVWYSSMRREHKPQEPMKRLPLPVGNSDWAHVVEHDWHADKTQLISGLLYRDATVALFTRPRRFGKEALQFFRNFLSSALKDGKHCRLGVMTGILRVARDSYLNGELSEDLNSVFDGSYSDCFGFTADEVKSLLTACGHMDKFEKIQRWCGGFIVGNVELFNPGAVLDFVKNGFETKSQLGDKGDDDIVDFIKVNLTPRVKKKLKEVIAGEEAFVGYDRFPDGAALFGSDETSVFTSLVHAGHLRACGKHEHGCGCVEFPNQERKVFWESLLKGNQQ